MINAKELKEITKNLVLLYVEDEDELRNSLGVYLNKLFRDVFIARDGQEGLELYKTNQIDLVVSDIQMPNLDGLEMSKLIKEIDPTQEIIITSAYSDASYFLNSIKIGVSGYIIKPIDYVQMNQEIYKSSVRVVQAKENLDYKLNLEAMVSERTEKIIAMEAEKIKNFETTILSFVEMIEDRDTYTGGHSQRVAKYSKLIAQDMNFSQEDCELLYKSGIIHDIGKIATPDSVLLKPGKLNDLEYKLIQEHVSVGYRLLSKIPMYQKHAEIILGHHERYDGKGYPNGLKGNEILPLSRILLLADAFDAMTTNRIYKGRKDVSCALKELEKLSQKQFHPEVVKSAIKVLVNIEVPLEDAQLPKTEVEKERFSYFFRDQITNAYNDDYLHFVLDHNIATYKYCCLTKLYLHHFNDYNTSYGWARGDRFLSEFVDFLSENYSEAIICRVHGDDFVLITKEAIEVDLDEIHALNMFKDNKITVSKKSINLKNKNLLSVEELEKLI